MKDCHKIVLLISIEIFRNFYNILNINDNVFLIDCIFLYILIYFQLSHKFKMTKIKFFDKCLIL